MNKKVANEIVKAGFRTLCKTYHPDMGGSHNAMIILKDTYEGLLKVLENGRWPQEEAPKKASGPGPRGQTERENWEQRSKHWSDDFRDKAQGKTAGQGPKLERYQYAKGYFVIRDVHCVGQSPKAIQVMFPGNPTPAWLPRSQLHSNSINKEGDRGDLIITDWIAAQKGWSVR